MRVTPGERILLTRTRLNMTKKELALRAGTTVATISKYEKSKNGEEFETDIIFDVAYALGVSVNWIQHEYDDPKEDKELKGLVGKRNIDS